MKREQVPANGGAPIGGSFQISMQMPNGSNISFSGYVIEGETLDQINARVDTLVAAARRQQQLAELPFLKDKVAAMEQQLQDQIDAYDALKAKESKLTSSEKLALQNAPVNIKRFKEELLKGLKKVEEIEGKAA